MQCLLDMIKSSKKSAKREKRVKKRSESRNGRERQLGVIFSLHLVGFPHQRHCFGNHTALVEAHYDLRADSREFLLSQANKLAN